MKSLLVGTRVKAEEKVSGIPVGAMGTVVATHDKGYTVEWDKPGLFKNAFDNVSGHRLLTVIKEPDKC